MLLRVNACGDFKMLPTVGFIPAAMCFKTYGRAGATQKNLDISFIV